MPELSGILRSIVPQSRASWKLWQTIADTFLTPLSALIFIRSSLVGLAMWIVLLQTKPLAIAAFLSMAGIEILRRPLLRYGVTEMPMELRANALLGALFTSWIVTPMDLHPIAPILVVAIAVSAILYFGELGYSVMRDGRFPLAVLPHCAWAAILLTLFPEAAADSSAYFDWPFGELHRWNDLPYAFLASAGVFVFSPSILSGAIIAFLVLAWSPAMFFSGGIGWIGGAAVSIGLVQLGVGVDWEPTSYNGFLAGMALGAVFVEPNWRSLSLTPFVGALTALIAATLQVITDYSGISYLPVPFMLVLFSGILMRSVITGDTRPAPHFERSPECRRISADWIAARWKGRAGPLLALPLEGPVQVTQGIDGALTHRGPWRYALDLQAPSRPDGGGERPSVWGRGVYSPVEGVVEAVRNDLPDNPPGEINYGENWGNYAILRAATGEHVALCHLAAGSVQVQEGQPLGFRTMVGKVGNSGRSSVPHLHLQAQESSRLGAPTVAFRIANYLQIPPVGEQEGCRWHAAGFPREGDVIAAGLSMPATHDLLTGILPGRSMWVAGPETDRGPLSTVTSLTEEGLLRISCRQEGAVDLEYDVDALRVVDLDAPEGTFIAALAMGLSTVPYAAYAGVRWTDALHVPSRGFLQRVQRRFSPFTGSPLSSVEVVCDELGPDGLSLSAQATMPGASGLASIELTLAPMRGPVRLVYRQDSEAFEYTLASFEVHAR